MSQIKLKLCIKSLMLFICLPVLVQAKNYPAANVKMTLEKVSEHVYYVQGPAGVATDNEGFISNAVAVISNKGIIIIDSLGTPSLAALFLEKLKAVTDKAVVKVIVTHYHADHIYGLQVFKEQGAHIIAPAGYTDYLDGPNAQQRLEERRFSLEPWVNDDTHLVIPDEVIDKNTSFTLGDIDIDINYLGSAHSDGDLTVFVKQDNVLITGDIIFEGRVPFTGSADTAHWLSLLEKLKTKNIVALVPGHGGAAKDPNAAIQLTLRYLQQVRAIMKAAVDDLMPFADAYDEADWSEFEELPAFAAAHRRNAYGIYLSLEREMLDE